jgi:hypothetical protein
MPKVRVTAYKSRLTVNLINLQFVLCYHLLLGNSPIDLPRLESVTLYYRDARTWIWVIKNTLELSLARFNMYNIYTMYKRVPFHQSTELEIRDAEQLERPSPSDS